MNMWMKYDLASLAISHKTVTLSPLLRCRQAEFLFETSAQENLCSHKSARFRSIMINLCKCCWLSRKEHIQWYICIVRVHIAFKVAPFVRKCLYGHKHSFNALIIVPATYNTHFARLAQINAWHLFYSALTKWHTPQTVAPSKAMPIKTQDAGCCNSHYSKNNAHAPSDILISWVMISPRSHHHVNHFRITQHLFVAILECQLRSIAKMNCALRVFLNDLFRWGTTGRFTLPDMRTL